MSIIHKCDFIPVCSINGDSSDHKVLVDYNDASPAFLFDKISNTSLIKLIADEQDPGKFKFVVNDDSSSSSELLRCISNFSLNQIDSLYTTLHADDSHANVLAFPITISLGEIKSFAIYLEDPEDKSETGSGILSIDKMEIAIVSNTSNTLANAKLEFLAKWYGFNNENNTCKPGNDYKSFIMHTYDDAPAQVSQYNSVSDETMNYHFVILYVHANSNTTKLLGKDVAQNKLVEVGKNMNYCGRWENQETIFANNIIAYNSSTNEYSLANASIETNMNGAIPYIEFYQTRSINNINGVSDG